jgi:hypothetical protein
MDKIKNLIKSSLKFGAILFIFMYIIKLDYKTSICMAFILDSLTDIEKYLRKLNQAQNKE